jgi:hypothetical protein
MGLCVILLHKSIRAKLKWTVLFPLQVDAMHHRWGMLVALGLCLTAGLASGAHQVSVHYQTGQLVAPDVTGSSVTLTVLFPNISVSMGCQIPPIVLRRGVARFDDVVR